jgi:hypothetical protein
MNNYRTISLLTAMSKSLYIIMFKRLEQHLESNNILTTDHSGFRKCVHIENAVFSLTNNIITSLNQRQQVGGIFCDLTKEFDCVNHTILLNKLHYYGIRGKCHHCFKSYLENRKQRVCISPHILEQQKSSSWETVVSRVPQGSILGPLLFIIYLNDLTYGLHQSAKPVIYADDTSVLLTAKNDELKNKINCMLDYMTGWLSANGLTLNMEKTNIMKFTSSYHQNEAFQIIYQKKIAGTNNTKFLGLKLDKNISWKNHVQKTIPKLSSACNLVRRMYPCCNSNTLKMIYFTYFIPLWNMLSYCGEFQ